MADRGREALPAGLEIGSAVTVHTTANPGQKGVIKYWGPIVGATGAWLGIELDTPTGKNSGSSGGQPYFECRPNHGVFLKPNQVKLIEVTEEEAKRRIKPKAGVASGSLIGTGLKSLGKKKGEEDKAEEPADEEEKKGKEKLRQEARLKAEARKEAVLKKVSEKRERASMAADEELPSSQPEESALDLARLKVVIRARDETIEQLQSDLRRVQLEFEEAKQESAVSLKRFQASAEDLETSLRMQISDLENKLKAKPKQTTNTDSSDLQDMIEQLTLDKEIAEGNCETLQKEKEELEEQLSELKDEIELRNLELEQIQSEGGGDVGSAELKLAFKKLYAEAELKRVHFEDRIMVLEHQVSSIPALQAKADQLLTIRAELEKKDAELNELREALDEASSYGSMLEKLTEDNLHQGERIKELEGQLEEIEELRSIETQIAEDQAELEKFLNDEIHNKDVEILELKRLVERKDEDVADLERVINQFRQKVVQLSNEGSVMKDQLEKSGEAEKFKKMQELIEKNIQLQNKARELRGHGLNSKISDLQKDQMQSQISSLLPVFPAEMLEALEFQGLQNLTMLRTTYKKAALLVSELLERIGDYQSQPNLLAWLFDVSSCCINYMSVSRGLETALKDMSVEKYRSISRAADWGQVSALNSSLDYIFRLLKDENLTASTPLDTLKLCIEAVGKFKDLHGAQSAVQYEVGRLVYIAVVGVSVAYSIHGLNRSFSGSVEVQEILSRMSLISQKLLASNYQYDLDPALSELQSVLAMKLQTLTQLLFGDKRSLASTFDWFEWIASIDRDIKIVTITSAFKQLTEEEPTSVPWKTLIRETQSNLEQYQKTIMELSATKTQIKELSLKIVILEKELSELRITKSNLESRLADAHMKAQRLAQLELESKRLLDKEKHYEESMQSLRLANEKLTKRNAELEDEMKKFQEEDQDQVGFLMKPALFGTSGTSINLNRGSGLVHAQGPQRLQSGAEDVEICKSIIDVLQIEKVRLSSEFLLSKLRSSADTPPPCDPSPANELISKLRSVRSSVYRKIASAKIVDLTRPDYQLKQAGQNEEISRLCKEAKTIAGALSAGLSGDGTSFKTSMGSSCTTDLAKSQLVKLGSLRFGNGCAPPVEVQVTRNELRCMHEVFNLV